MLGRFRPLQGTWRPVFGKKTPGSEARRASVAPHHPGPHPAMREHGRTQLKALPRPAAAGIGDSTIVMRLKLARAMAAQVRDDESGLYRVRGPETPQPAAPHTTGTGRWSYLQSVDPYQLLNVRRGASPVELEQAYRRYVRTIHPDTCYGDVERRREAERKLREVNALMSVVRDVMGKTSYERAPGR